MASAPAAAELGVEDVAAQRHALVAQRDAAAAEPPLDLVLELAAPRADVGRAHALAGRARVLELLGRGDAEFSGRVDREATAQRPVARGAHHDELAALESLRADRAVHRD